MKDRVRSQPQIAESEKKGQGGKAVNMSQGRRTGSGGVMPDNLICFFSVK